MIQLWLCILSFGLFGATPGQLKVLATGMLGDTELMKNETNHKVCQDLSIQGGESHSFACVLARQSPSNQITPMERKVGL